jgi:hypothetical protein
MQRSPWRQLAVLICLALAVPVAQYVTMYHGRAPDASEVAVLWAALLESPRQFYYLLAVVPAIAIGTASVDRRGVRTALAAVGATLLIMVTVDLWISPAADRELATLAMHPPAGWPERHATVALPGSPVDSIGVLRTAAKYLRQPPPEVGERLRVYPQSHPRLVAERVMEDAAMLLLPFILAGITIGVGLWVRAHVIFRRAADEVIARWFLAWIVAPAAFALIGTWSSRYSYEILFQGGSLWLPLLPYAPFAVLGALGWRAALNARGPEHTGLITPSVEPDTGPSSQVT